MPLHILFGIVLWKQILYYLKPVFGTSHIDYTILQLLHIDFCFKVCNKPMREELEDAANP